MNRQFSIIAYVVTLDDRQEPVFNRLRLDNGEPVQTVDDAVMTLRGGAEQVIIEHSFTAKRAFLAAWESEQ